MWSLRQDMIQCLPQSMVYIIGDDAHSVSSKEAVKTPAPHASVLEQIKELVYTRWGVPDAPEYDSEDDISWKSSDDDQDDEQDTNLISRSSIKRSKLYESNKNRWIERVHTGAFQVTADAPEIYMQEFWASAYVSQSDLVRFKMNKSKTIIGLEQFRDILQICPKVDIRKLTDVNVNKLHQPWRSFAAVINKCLSGTPSYDSLRLSQAQILWGMYNKKNVDYAYLLWEDFIFKIENKSTKKGSAIDDPMFTTINVILRNEATQLYGAILPVALTNEDIRNSESYKEYYAMASGIIPPKTKGSKKKAKSRCNSLTEGLPLPPRKRSLEKENKRLQSWIIS
ncbi:hypothetical protein Tco_0585785 [Tanacetum coccineum]